MKLLTLARDLQRRKARERQSLFVAEGVRAVEELLDSPSRVVGALITAAASASERLAKLRGAMEDRGIELAEVSERDFLQHQTPTRPRGSSRSPRSPSGR